MAEDQDSSSTREEELALLSLSSGELIYLHIHEDELGDQSSLQTYLDLKCPTDDKLGEPVHGAWIDTSQIAQGIVEETRGEITVDNAHIEAWSTKTIEVDEDLDLHEER